ncbi:hypothetical protein [Sphingopyxis flava]|uniref:Uncharacterized protein n=1 Tax=Sphingopyxis flava TaxID=1507287 RepID=A0A1T5ABR2_9SPHN|nr:hypothetical protein [Sphingopyxis flava]SKB32350.1 hypothetical protein SAMN06295937_100371 [Sphingopyxis flava]
MSSLYNRTELTPFTRATAEQVNAETAKIKGAIDALQILIGQIVAGTPLASYTWMAFADSADGTANFTTGEPGDRQYIGLAYGRATDEESAVPGDYVWTRFRGADGVNGTDGSDGTNGSDGTDGEDGNYRDIKFQRASSQPATPILAAPAGWFDAIPTGEAALWFTVATKSAAGELLSTWSIPARLNATVNRGPYDAGTTYYHYETVTFNGGTYMLTVESSTGNAPSGTSQANAYWDVVAAPGSEGAPATPPSAFSATIDLTSSAAGANLRTIADAAGYTGMSDATITFNVPNGVTIQGVTGSGKGVDTGSWPSTSYAVNLALVVQNGGKIYGGGGRGGDGGGGIAGAGGDAVYCREDIDITIDSGGGIWGAGGGGGGGSGSFATGFVVKNGGGGGGGGFPNGAGGAGGIGDINDGSPGNDATISGGGTGGAGGGAGATAGGAGGNAASAGASSGGAAGYAVRKNGFTVPVTNNGSMTGTAG